MKNEHSLLKTTVLLYGLQIVALLMQFVRSSVFAYYFGTTWEADAYNVALKVPTVLFAVIATAIKTVVIPIYSKQLYERGKEAADKFYSNLLTTTVAVGIIFSILITAFSKEVVLRFAPGLDTRAAELASKLTKVFSVTIAMLSVINIQDGVMNVYKKYTYTKVSSEIAIFVRVILLLLFAGTMGIYAAVIGFLLGTVCSLITSSIGTRTHAHYSFFFSFQDEGLKLALRNSIPVFIGVGVAEVNRVIDGIVASYMNSGSISSLNYASTLETSIVSLCITIINTVYYPVLSRQIAKKESDEANETFNHVLSLLTYISVPLLIGGILLRTEMVSIVYHRGSFNATNVAVVAELFAIYLFGIVFVGIRHAASNVLYAMNNTKTPMFNSAIGVCVNIVLNLVLGYFFGVYGLAIATSASMVVATVCMLVSTKKGIAGLSFGKFKTAIWKSIIAALFMGVVVYLFRNINGIGLYLKFCISLLAGALIYITMLVILKASEIVTLIESTKRKFRKDNL